MIASLPRTARLGLSLLAVLASQHAAAVVVKDIAGRSVNVPDKVERVLLGEGRLFYALSLLEGKKPLARIAGWQGDFRMRTRKATPSTASTFPRSTRSR